MPPSTPRRAEDGKANRSAAAVIVARWFELDVTATRGRVPEAPRAGGLRASPTLSEGAHSRPASRRDAATDAYARLDPPRPGQIVWLTGPSGGGKSTLLRRLAAQAARDGTRIVDVGRIRLRRVACVDQAAPPPRRTIETPATVEERARRGLRLLSQVGLAEARTYLRLPHELSDGQRWRLRLAVAAARCERASRRGTPVLLVADEFTSLLDRVTAAVVARALRKLIDRLVHRHVPAGALVATAHDDLARALAPDVTVNCDFDEAHC